MQSGEWYYVGQLGQIGPLTMDQVVELIDANVITPETHVWHSGMSDWTEAGQVAEIRKFFAVSTSPPPFVPRRRTRLPHEMLPVPQYVEVVSPKSRLVAGLLQIFLSGAGRLYLGYSAIGVLQILTSIFTCGVLHLWSFIDGLLILLGHVRYDGYGRDLTD